MKTQCQRTEAQYQCQRDLMHGLQATIEFVQNGHLHRGGHHKNAGGNVNVINLECTEKQQDGEEVEYLLHGCDYRALKSSDAEFMQ